jgi:hypothetical protein
MDGFAAFINRNLLKGTRLEDILSSALQEIWNISGGKNCDDVSIAALACREANTVNILTGPPSSNKSDVDFVGSFMEADGLKAVCGSSTAEMVSRCIGKSVDIVGTSTSYLQPPMYKIDGIDIVTEGAVTLNQLYNILGEVLEMIEESSCVSDLCRLIKSSDIVRFYMGEAENLGHKSITFKQMGIIPRHQIVPLIAQRLKAMGKLVELVKR